MNDKTKPEILRQDETREILLSVTNPTTNQLLNMAVTCLLHKYVKSGQSLVSDFDLKFFAESMLEFCSKHENLKRILEGEDLRWFDDKEVL